jgi:hypothetical protein
MTPAYPLTWPFGIDRTARDRRVNSQFKTLPPSKTSQIPFVDLVKPRPRRSPKSLFQQITLLATSAR